MILSNFLAPYIDFIDENFGRENHHYVFITSEKYDYGLTPEHKVEFLHTDDDIFIILLKYMKMAKKIMIQGTMSNVGKSLLAGGLCRVLKEDGIKVAPFKSQNMALNSFITADGLEMGRAQVMQAEAAGIEACNKTYTRMLEMLPLAESHIHRCRWNDRLPVHSICSFHRSGRCVR